MIRPAIALLASIFMFAGTALAEDIQAGEQVFKKCRACHAVGVDAKNKVGPQLNGLFGRSAGSVEGYRYSDANANSGIVWSEENFAEYIRNPRGYLPGTKMAYVGLKKDDEVVDIIAYLRQFQSDGTIAAAQ
jgi:cytochrome c